MLNSKLNFMKSKLYILFLALTCLTSACKKLDIAPKNVIQDPDVFSTPGGIDIYMARSYSELPIEDFRYSPERGFNNFWIISPFSALTGEALSRDQTRAMPENFNTDPNNESNFWAMSYKLIRETNYFIEILPKYSANFTEAQVNNWTGEARFLRAATYFALVKRYGGVPIVEKVLSYPEQTVEELNTPRASEEAVYDLVAADLDFAIAKMSESSVAGRANKYVAAAFKSRAMLFAGSIAKYNKVNLFDGDKNLVCGIPAAKANTYYKASYDASMLLDGKYSLYKKAWAANDQEAQYQNFVNLFFDVASPENIFVKQYNYPNTVHGYDAYNVPRQLMGGNGYSSELNPTLDYVELFDGFPKNLDGTIKTLDANGNYVLYNNTLDIFSSAEPRLRATVILPGDVMKGESIEIRRGIYTGSPAGGIKKFVAENSTSNYPTTNIVQSANANQTPYKLPNGQLMNPAGKSGVFTAEGTAAVSGFSIRKYLDPNMPTSEVLENHSDQTWIELRYAEVLLNRAEAAFELNSSGLGGVNYQQQAFTDINQIRERAGAALMGSPVDLTIDVIRKERRKEMGFENKIWWDLKRWRILDKEQNGKIYRTLMPFYVADAGKYILDARLDERNVRYTFDPRWYYEQIPAGEIAKSNKIIQNPGY
ncbi:MAG: Starch-binding associating with outer rane [Pedobacter sp.]|jgi:hypothetical protein|nr:Starch-binding associating with outer rane [Pedobacter sp.]